MRTILARVLTHIPQPNRQLVHFYGAYANRVRRTYRDQIRPEDEDNRVLRDAPPTNDGPSSFTASSRSTR